MSTLAPAASRLPRLPWQLPLRHRLLQPLPHPVQLKRGAGAAGIPRKHSAAVTAAGAAAGQPARGRGSARGNIGIRGAAVPSAGRGAQRALALALA